MVVLETVGIKARVGSVESGGHFWWVLSMYFVFDFFPYSLSFVLELII